jgi:uncharacterized protein YlxP (DUF503 family)
MVVGVLRLSLTLRDNFDLKSKRRVVRSLVDKIRNHYKVAVAETDLQDLHQSAEIGVALVGNDRRVLNAVIDRIVTFATEEGSAEVTGSAFELFNYE